LRQDRQAAEMPADIVRQCVDRCVALFGLLVQRLEHDGVEIAAQRARLRRAGGARAHGFGLHDGVFQRATGIPPQPVGARAGQQFMQHHAQRVHVGGDGDGLAENLLGRGVVGRQRMHRQLRETRRKCVLASVE
jgi:hypothetical protein